MNENSTPQPSHEAVLQAHHKLRKHVHKMSNHHHGHHARHEVDAQQAKAAEKKS